MVLIFNDIAGSEVLLILVFILIFFGSKSIPTLARTLGKTMRQIKEASSDLVGINVDVVPIREYVSPDIAPHILGAIGPIYAKDVALLKKGYLYDDYLGRSGVEKAFETYLRGTNGEKEVVQSSSGKTISETIKEPIPGNTVMLTTDKNLQSVAQKSLSNMINNLNTQNIQATAGAVVVIDINSGEILASANYPSYDMNTYKNDYAKLLADKSKPLFDRAFVGTYPPGSSFKPAMASIGLQTGVITPTSTVKCTKYYDYYDKINPPKCLSYHGSINVISALSKSCNFFFYDTGRKIGIDIMNNYCRLYGLGVSTGVEIPESTGTLAGPDYSKSQNKTWYLGNTLQAAIGQSDNAFTPLQLAAKPWGQ